MNDGPDNDQRLRRLSCLLLGLLGILALMIPFLIFLRQWEALIIDVAVLLTLIYWFPGEDPNDEHFFDDSGE